MNKKVLFSTLWIFVTMNYIFCDVFTLFHSESLKQLMTGEMGGMKINQEFQEPLLGWSANLPEEPMNFLKLLKDTVSKNIIKLDTVQASTFRGGEIILSLFEAISNEPEMLLPASFKKLWRESEDEFGQKRIICDFISGMTDQYANRFYQRLFIPGHGSVFDRL